jgi:hypothetical protein
MEMFNLKKLNKVEGKGQYCVEVSNRFIGFGRFGRRVGKRLEGI